MADLDWRNPNSLKLVVRIIGIEIMTHGLEGGKDYFAIVQDGINKENQRTINIMSEKDQKFKYTYYFNVENKDNHDYYKYNFDNQFILVWHETQTPYRSDRTNFQKGDTIIFTNFDHVYLCLRIAITKDEESKRDPAHYKNYMGFPDPKLIITKVQPNFNSTGKTRLTVKNPNAEEDTEFSVMWSRGCWADSYELLPAGSTVDEDTPTPIPSGAERTTNRRGGKRKSRRTHQKNTHRRSRKR